MVACGLGGLALSGRRQQVGQAREGGGVLACLCVWASRGLALHNALPLLVRARITRCLHLPHLWVLPSSPLLRSSHGERPSILLLGVQLVQLGASTCSEAWPPPSASTAQVRALAADRLRKRSCWVKPGLDLLTQGSDSGLGRSNGSSHLHLVPIAPRQGVLPAKRAASDAAQPNLLLVWWLLAA